MKPVNSEVLAREFDLKWRIGARTGALLVHQLGQFSSKITIWVDGFSFDAKSILGWLASGGETESKIYSKGRRIYNMGPKAGARVRVPLPLL